MEIGQKDNKIFTLRPREWGSDSGTGGIGGTSGLTAILILLPISDKVLGNSIDKHLA